MTSLNTEIIISEFLIKNTNHHHHHQPNGTKSLPCYGIHVIQQKIFFCHIFLFHILSFILPISLSNIVYQVVISFFSLDLSNIECLKKKKRKTNIQISTFRFIVYIFFNWIIRILPHRINLYIKITTIFGDKLSIIN